MTNSAYVYVCICTSYKIIDVIRDDPGSEGTKKRAALTEGKPIQLHTSH